MEINIELNTLIRNTPDWWKMVRYVQVDIKLPSHWREYRNLISPHAAMRESTHGIHADRDVCLVTGFP